MMAVLSFILELDQRQRYFFHEYATHRELGWNEIGDLLGLSASAACRQLFLDAHDVWHPPAPPTHAEDCADYANLQQRIFNAGNGYVSFTLMRAVVNLRPEEFLCYVLGQAVDAGCNTPCLDNVSQPSQPLLHPRTADYFKSLEKIPKWCLPGSADREVRKGFIAFSSLLCRGKGKVDNSSLTQGPPGASLPTARGKGKADNSSLTQGPPGASLPTARPRLTLGARPRGSYLPPPPPACQSKVPQRRRAAMLDDDEPTPDADDVGSGGSCPGHSLFSPRVMGQYKNPVHSPTLSDLSGGCTSRKPNQPLFAACGVEPRNLEPALAASPFSPGGNHLRATDSDMECDQSEGSLLCKQSSQQHLPCGDRGVGEHQPALAPARGLAAPVLAASSHQPPLQSMLMEWDQSKGILDLSGYDMQASCVEQLHNVISLKRRDPLVHLKVGTMSPPLHPPPTRPPCMLPA
jgi:hypothetical protein